MGKETLIPAQNPADISRKVFDRLSSTDQTLSRDEVTREVSDLWNTTKTPALRQFIAPLAENTLRKKRP